MENEYLGLSDEEVKERIRLGKVNKYKATSSKTPWNIVRSNLFTLFNAINLVLFIMVLAAGSPKNGMFAGVIITNSVVGIIQEFRAKRIVEKISVLKAVIVKVIRNGYIKQLHVDEIVVDDVILISEGEQVVVDSELLTEEPLEIDESLLTGESRSIKKCSGDLLYAGSLVLGGAGYIRAKMVGADTYAAKLAKEAKKFKLAKSELQRIVDKVLKLTIKFILPIGILLIVTQVLYTDRDKRRAYISAISGIVGMIPEGLVLLITAASIVSVIRLFKLKTLVQELPATEILARVDTLCLDKTGTITEGKLSLTAIVPLNKYSEEKIGEVLGSLSSAFISSNATLSAIEEKYRSMHKMEAIKTIPFSSDKKWSAAEFSNGEKWIMGAPEVVLGSSYEEVKESIEKEARNCRRGLVLAKLLSEELSDELSDELSEDLPENIEGAALIYFEDMVREDAAETLRFFDKQKVDIKIISGDNPITVSAVAKKAGVKNAEKYVDGRYLPEDEEELHNIIESTTVFGRTTPHQKKAIVEALQRRKKTVAMTGDGVNDVLALKASDCGIAMASGSDASKAVAQLVLLDSNFNALPYVVAEGRRTINNIENVSKLYLSKTIYSMMLSVIFCLLLLPYPIMPIQLSWIGTIAIGMPSFFLAMEANEDMVKEGFLKRLLLETIPNGATVTLCTVVMVLLTHHNKLRIYEIRTLTFIVIYGISLIILLKICIPLTKLRALLLVVVALISGITFFIPFSKSFFIIYKVDIHYILFALLLIALSPFFMAAVKFMIKAPLEKHFSK